MNNLFQKTTHIGHVTAIMNIVKAMTELYTSCLPELLCPPSMTP